MINVSIYFEDIEPVNIIKNNITKLSENILSDFNYKSIHLNIIVTSDKYLADMKKEYFKLDQFTDVIAFTIDDTPPLIEGELYISFDRVCDNASIFNVPANDELKRVISHGLLHLVGLDDSTELEREKMTQYENKYINSIENIIGV